MGKRRTKAEMEALREAIYAALEDDHPMTVRQVFYRLTVRSVVPKTENQYKNTVCRLLANMRRDEVVPYGWVADNTRWVRRAQTYDSMEEALRQTARTYRRSLWSEGDVYVEIWLEKEALAGVLVEETDRWDIPLYVTRGYPSLSYLHEAAETINDIGKPTILYYFGDHDPSGVDISRNVREGIKEFVDRPELVTFKRVAVRREQIEAWNLPTRPTKRSDSRSKNFDGRSVEVDAIPPKALRGLVRECVERHVNRRELEMLRNIEEQERATLSHIAENLAA